MLATLAPRSRSAPSGRAVLAVASSHRVAKYRPYCSQNFNSFYGFARANRVPGSDRIHVKCD